MIEKKKELCNFCALLYNRQLTVSAGGNMSIRVGDKIIITPSGKNKGFLKPEDLVVLDLNGNVLEGGKPSIEKSFHLAYYRCRPEINAVVHCHPLHCTALAVKNEAIKPDLTPEGILLLGHVPMVPYFTPGSIELSNAVEKEVGFNVILLEKHGALTCGKSLEEAYNRMEELEFQAKLQLLIPNTNSLPNDEILKLKEMKL